MCRMFSTKPAGWRLGRREKTKGREKEKRERRKNGEERGDKRLNCWVRGIQCDI